jgi:hypothetical protein
LDAPGATEDEEIGTTDADLACAALVADWSNVVATVAVAGAEDILVATNEGTGAALCDSTSRQAHTSDPTSAAATAFGGAFGGVLGGTCAL